MSTPSYVKQFQKVRNIAKSVYFALSILIGLILGICSEMLAGIKYESSHYFLDLFASFYITVAPVFLVTFIFYLLKLIVENLGVLVFIERAIYEHKKMLNEYEEFLGDREKQLLFKKLKDRSAHLIKWLLRSILYTIGVLACLPFIMASAMYAASIHAPTLIIYNVFIVGTLFPLIVAILFCEAMICIVGKIKNKAAKKAISSNLP
jgi:hypothetical protein